MNPAYARALAVLLTLGVLPVAGIVLTRPLAPPVHPPAHSPREAAAALTLDATVDSLSRMAGRSGAFRSSRTPALRLFDAKRSFVPSVAAAPRPILVLTGIVWGRDPAAVIEGLPGLEGGRLVRRGDVVNGVAIRQITRTSLSAAGLDTTWSLKVRESWR